MIIPEATQAPLCHFSLNFLDCCIHLQQQVIHLLHTSSRWVTSFCCINQDWLHNLLCITQPDHCPMIPVSWPWIFTANAFSSVFMVAQLFIGRRFWLSPFLSLMFISPTLASSLPLLGSGMNTSSYPASFLPFRTSALRPMLCILQCSWASVPPCWIHLLLQIHLWLTSTHAGLTCAYVMHGEIWCQQESTCNCAVILHDCVLLPYSIWQKNILQVLECLLYMYHGWYTLHYEFQQTVPVKNNHSNSWYRSTWMKNAKRQSRS